MAIENKKPVIEPQMTPDFNLMASFAKLGEVFTGTVSQFLVSLPGQQTNGGLNLSDTVKGCLADPRVNDHQPCFGPAKKFYKLLFGIEKQIDGPGLQKGLLFAGKKILQCFQLAKHLFVKDIDFPGAV